MAADHGWPGSQQNGHVLRALRRARAGAVRRRSLETRCHAALPADRDSAQPAAATHSHDGCTAQRQTTVYRHNGTDYCNTVLASEPSNKWIAVRKVASPLRELTCHTGSHSVTCHQAELTFPPLPQPKLVLD